MTYKNARLVFFIQVFFGIAILALFAVAANAQVEGSCWEVKSDLKKAKRINCAAVNDSPFVIPVDQNRVMRQLRQFRPIPHALVLERGAEHNRKHGNSRLERFEKRGLPLAGILGAAGVIGSGVVTAGVSAALPMVFPAVRSWFMEASSPLWAEAPQLLSDTEIIMQPGSSAGFWFYAEKGGMEGEFRILPMEMGVVESKLQENRLQGVSGRIEFGSAPLNGDTRDPFLELGDVIPYDGNSLFDRDTLSTYNSTEVGVPAIQVRRISAREPVFQPAPVAPPAPPAPAPRQEPEFRYYLRTIAK